MNKMSSFPHLHNLGRICKEKEMKRQIIFLVFFRSDIDTLQFQMTFEIPHIRVRAQYRSSGVLILVKASGAGDYWGEYGIQS